MKCQKIDLFPTTILKFDFSDYFNDQEINLLINDVNNFSKDNSFLVNFQGVPKHQSKKFLFHENAPHHWQKLKSSFIESFYTYLSVVKYFCSGQESIELTYTHAWFYNSNKLSHVETRESHNHSPSLLSGVFYLKLPYQEQQDNNYYNGTSFADPRISTGRSSYHQLVESSLYSWLIFPSWLYHQAGRCNTEENRITIAADGFAKVI